MNIALRMLSIDNIKRSRMSYTLKDDFCYPETNRHPWSLTHLQASLYVSDAKVLKMTSLRTELIPQRAVKYEVRWKGMLFDKQKFASGHLLKIIRFRFNQNEA